MAEEAGTGVESTTTDTSATQTEPTQEARTFTQADVDRMFKHRLEEEKRRHFSDYEELKARAARLDEIEAENMSELEKERAARTAAEERATRVEKEAQEIQLRSAILAEAAKPDRKIVDPDLVATLLMGDVEIDADGSPTNVAKAMDSLLEARPYLVASNGGTRGSADQGARTPGDLKNQLGQDALSSMTPEQIVAARKEGRFDALMRGETT